MSKREKYIELRKEHKSLTYAFFVLAVLKVKINLCGCREINIESHCSKKI